MMPSGASCSPPSCWSSCSYGDRQPITRGEEGSSGSVLPLSLCRFKVTLCVSGRYAFSPLLDEESEEEEKEPMMNEAFGQ